jgi:hypothetical protein
MLNCYVVQNTCVIRVQRERHSRTEQAKQDFYRDKYTEYLPELAAIEDKLSMDSETGWAERILQIIQLPKE